MSIYFEKFSGKEDDVTEKPRSAAEKIGLILGIICIPLAVMLLWNWLMPAIFGLPTIGYFKSVGLLVLSLILLK